MPNASVVNPMADIYQTQLEASRQFADAVFSGTEKIDRMVIDAAHRAFTDQLKFVQAFATARDPKGVANLPATFLARPENAINYQKEILQIFAEIQMDISKSLQQYTEQFKNKAAGNIAKPLEAVQDQTRSAVFNPLTGMFSVWESAFKEVSALANKNMMAARSTFENAAQVASNSASNIVHETARANHYSTDKDEVDDKKTSSSHHRRK